MDVMRLADKAANFQVLHELVRCVLVLEEVGVTVGSIHNPLMLGGQGSLDGQWLLCTPVYCGHIELATG